MFKVNNRNTKERCEICSKSTIKTPERCQHRSSAVIGFEQVNVSWIIRNSQSKKLLEVNYDNKFKFEKHLNTIYHTEPTEKWMLLAKQTSYMELKKGYNNEYIFIFQFIYCTVIFMFLNLQFIYCTVICMFHSWCSNQ